MQKFLPPLGEADLVALEEIQALTQVLWSPQKFVNHSCGPVALKLWHMSSSPAELLKHRLSHCPRLSESVHLDGAWRFSFPINPVWWCEADVGPIFQELLLWAVYLQLALKSAAETQRIFLKISTFRPLYFHFVLTAAPTSPSPLLKIWPSIGDVFWKHFLGWVITESNVIS